MRRIKVTAMAFVVSLVVVSPGNATAQDKEGHAADLPDYRPGETFIFSNKRVEHIKSIDDDLITLASRKDHQYTRHRNIVLPVMQWRMAGKTGRRSVHGNAAELWPLRVGNSAGFRILSEIRDNEKQPSVRRVELWRCRVAAREDIHVPAGEFKSYRIVCDHYSENSMRILQRYTWHYSPAVGHYVRREVKNFFTGDSHSMELVATLPPGKGNALRIKALMETLTDEPAGR